jgi:hypothetical protein
MKNKFNKLDVNYFGIIFFQSIHVDEAGINISIVVSIINEVVICVINKAIGRVQLDYHAQTEIVIFEIVSFHLIENLQCLFIFILFQQTFYDYVEEHLILFN